MNIYEQYQRLPAQGFGLIDFFSINISEYDITCLAWYSTELFEKYKKFGFVFKLNINQEYLEADKDGIKIILSLKTK
ncbi:MAG: hypothetical protein RIT30_761 [Bacteroidota bacterium]|jgi:hypothetical protein